MIALSIPNICGNEKKYVMEALEQGWVSTAGKFVDRFEENISTYLNVESAVACQSGTAGLHLALLAAGVKQNDMVIVPTLTFIAAVNPTKYIGAETYFIDCDKSLCMDPVKLEKYLCLDCELREDGHTYDKASGRKIAALVVVHVFGNMADMVKILDLSKKYNFRIVEDATEALGTKYIDGPLKGKFAGTMGDFGVFSFNGNKIITTGGGGMIVAKNKEDLNHCRHLSTQAKKDVVYFDHDEIGYNYRMTNVQAAMGVAQLENLEQFITNKKLCYEYYKLEGLKLLPFRTDIRANYWFFSYMSNDRDALIKFLADKNIQTRPIWKLIHSLPMYESSPRGDLSVAEGYYNQVVNLPCSSNLLIEDVKEVASRIREFENMTK